ncbi:MAG: tRNA (guanosine(37)-N1)-methyltransferase TrmD [Candidatus Terrybacteria bacterium]|nr:tRNA (guanosine(37)-N1)-methyltransferase TrmD [Candidatus Terrybacteria bacterium]
MVFHLVTIFPEAIKGYFNSSILKRAQEKKLIKIKFYNPRDFTKDRHKKARPTERHQSFGRVDDKPFGGGPGMVMKIEPLIRTIGSIFKIKNQKSKCKIVLFSPTGRQFTQKMARDWAKRYDNIILIAGHYEGIDARLKKIIENWKLKIENLSIGPYVLTGGELPAGIIVDAVSRHIPGVLGKKESLEEGRGIGIPVYTRPEVFEHRGKKYRVPKVLLSGNHAKIEKWRQGLQKISNRI